MTVMTPVGSGIRGSIYHSHSFDATMTHIPGWKIVMPSSPLDAYGLMLTCIQDENPCMFLKPKALLRVKGEEPIPGEPSLDREGQKKLSQMIDAPLGDRTQWKAKWPEGLKDPKIPIGKGKIVHEGGDVTVVSYGRTLPLAKLVAQELRGNDGVSVEVIDMRTLWPYDWDLISESIKKTQKVLYINEDTEVSNFGEHLVRRTIEDFFYDLKARPSLLAGEFVPGIGLADDLEMASVPQKNHIKSKILELHQEVA